MKNDTLFFWAWRGYAPQPDTSMTRERAAKLLRSWRRSRTQGHRDFSLQRVAKGNYRIAARGYEDDYGIMVISQ